MINLKKSCIVVVLLCLSFCCFAQESQQSTSELNITLPTNLFNPIFDNLNLLENEQNSMSLFIENQKLQIENLEQLSQTQQAQIEKWESAYQDQVQLSLNLEDRLKQSQSATQKWKIFSIVLGTTTVTLGITTVVLIVVMVNK